MSVAEYYAQHVRDGRAIVGRPTSREPRIWIVMARSIQGGVSYWLCRRDYCEIDQLDPVMHVSEIKRPKARPRGWHKSLYRRPRLNSLTPDAMMELTL